MSLPFTKANDEGEDEPLVHQEYSKEIAKRLWGFQIFLRLRSHKVTKIVRTPPREVKGEGLRIAALNAGPMPEPPPPDPSTETQTTDTSWMVACGVMPPDPGGPQ